MEEKEKEIFSFDFEAKIPKVSKRTSIYKDIVQQFYDTGKDHVKVNWNGPQKLSSVVMGIRNAIKTLNVPVRLKTINKELYLIGVKAIRTERK